METIRSHPLCWCVLSSEWQYAIASTLYLIRANRFEGKERLQNTDQQRAIKGRECKHKTAVWSCCWRIFACLVLKHNHFGVFVQIRLANREARPTAVCLGVSRAKPTHLGGLQLSGQFKLWGESAQDLCLNSTIMLQFVSTNYQLKHSLK